MVRKSAPIMPSGVQLSRPIVPPGRHTRTSSSATCLVVRREHRADRGHDDVEGLVLERQVLGVGLDPLELEPLGLGRRAAGVEQLGRQVARDHVSRPPEQPGSRRCRCRRRRRGRACQDRCRRPRPVAGPAAAERLDHRRVVARRPHRAVARLQLGIVHRRRHGSSCPVGAADHTPRRGSCPSRAGRCSAHRHGVAAQARLRARGSALWAGGRRTVAIASSGY